MYKSLSFLLSITIVSCWLSCTQTPTQNISDEFYPFIETFFDAANNQGHNLELTDYNLSIKLTDINNPTHAGTCQTKNNKIEIDENFWNQYDLEHKEWLIFHELGHCILNRSHRNEKAENLECLSFMKGGVEDDFDCSLNLYSTLWKDYYLNELFDENYMLPEWYFENQNWYNQINNPIILVDTFFVGMEYENILPLEFNQAFLLEATFSEWANKINAVGILWDDLIIHYCNECTIDKLKIKKGSNTLYTNNEITENNNVKISLLKRKDLYSVFINEQLLHTFEFSEWENTRFKTLPYFEESISINIKLGIIE